MADAAVTGRRNVLGTFTEAAVLLGLAAGCATGVQFQPVTAQALAHALMRLVSLYQQKPVWTRMMANAMASPVGWSQSATAYAALYAQMVKPA